MNHLQRATELRNAIEELCLLVDEFSLCEFAQNTPLYNFQQSMIANVKRFREQKDDDDTSE